MTCARTCSLRGRRGGRRSLPAVGFLALGLTGGRAGRCSVRTARRRGDGHALVTVVEEAVELVRLEGLLFDELVHDEVELVAVLREDLVRAEPAALDDVVHLGVDDLRDVL